MNSRRKTTKKYNERYQFCANWWIKYRVTHERCDDDPQFRSQGVLCVANVNFARVTVTSGELPGCQAARLPGYQASSNRSLPQNKVWRARRPTPNSGISYKLLTKFRHVVNIQIKFQFYCHLLNLNWVGNEILFHSLLYIL